MNANIVKMQIFHKIKYDLRSFKVTINELFEILMKSKNDTYLVNIFFNLIQIRTKNLQITYKS